MALGWMSLRVGGVFRLRVSLGQRCVYVEGVFGLEEPLG